MTKRKLRSDTAAESKRESDTAAAQQPASVNSVPVAKRSKSAAPRYLCTCCDMTMLGRYFPNFNPSSECEHLINTCKACLQEWVEVQVDSSNFVRVREGGGASTFGIKCVECKEIMRPVNVEAAASKTVYEKFDRLARRHLAESIPNWRWCLAADCDHGQEHVKGEARETKEAKEIPKKDGRRKEKAETAQLLNDANLNVCTCNKCGARACVACDAPMHEEETCAEYRERTRSEENDASLKLIESSFKKCPNCSKSIEKNGGCEYMQCTQCRSAFCWECVQVYRHGQYCGCRPLPTAAAAIHAGAGPAPAGNGR